MDSCSQSCLNASRHTRSVSLSFVWHLSSVSISLSNLCLALVLIYFAVIQKSFTLVLALVTFNGFFSMSIYSVCFELGVELSYPVGEATSGGMINSLGNFLAFIVVLSITPFLGAKNDQGVINTFYFLGSLLVAGLLLMIFTKQKLKRQGFEKVQTILNSQIRTEDTLGMSQILSVSQVDISTTSNL